MSEQETIQKLKQWAESNEAIRALVLTSSRANESSAPVDQFSDYDVCVYANSLDYFKNDDWLTTFGNVLVCWPKHPRATLDENGITRLVIFESRLRIDFQITDIFDKPPGDFDLGYQVLLDKDGFTSNFPQSTKQEYVIKKPSEDEFLELVNDFFWDATYVPKYLWRDELFFAKFMFDSALRSYLVKIIEWQIGLENNWSVTTNKYGRYFKKFLSDSEWKQIETTFAGAHIEDNWQAFYTLVEFFTSIARKIAIELQFHYPAEQEEKVLAYYQKSKEIEK